MKLLVAVDLSESTRKIIDRIVAIAGDHPLQVWILHNAEPESDHVEFRVDPLAARETLAKKFHEAHCRIQEIAGRLRKAGLEATALLVHGKTVDTILQEAADLDVDIIAVGSHGWGAMYELLVGSVSKEVLRRSPVPVLVIPTHDRG
jgi:nucleotide-binding universal stress UspA family protein